jgi:two-component system chemotaxis response regulator CheB
MEKDIVVIGASAGGIEALRSLVARLPRNFRASIFVVTHTSPESPGVLATILERAGPLPALCVRDSAPIQPGRIYVPAPDHHLLVQPGYARATRGPRENRFRPAVDPLFRSAAQTYGPRVIGVILTGGLDDGTAGLAAVKKLGGTAVVQDPADALFPSMPQSAVKHVTVDHCVPLADIPALLVRLTRERAEDQGAFKVPENIRIEVDIAKEDNALDAGIMKLGEPSIYACPECHGVLLKIPGEGKERPRFRCHTGHAYSVESLLADMQEKTEDSLWSAVRAIEEHVLLLRHLAEHVQDHTGTAEELRRRADQVQHNAELVRRAVLDEPATEVPQS